MTSSGRFTINTPKVIHETFDDEVVIVNLGSGNYYSVNNVGADIWRLIERGVLMDDMIEGIGHLYEGSRGEIERAVDSLVDELQREGLIVPAPTTEPESTRGQRPSPDVESKAGRRPFEMPMLQKYTDMQELMLLDPIHEVDETGWPSTKPAASNEKTE